MRTKWKKLIAGMCVAAMGLSMFGFVSAPTQKVQATEVLEASVGRHVLNFNSDWGFYRGDLDNAQELDFDDSKFANVTLPHTMQLAKKTLPGSEWGLPRSWVVPQILYAG